LIRGIVPSFALGTEEIHNKSLTICGVRVLRVPATKSATHWRRCILLSRSMVCVAFEYTALYAEMHLDGLVENCELYSH
jgi:hypothetical protein